MSRQWHACTTLLAAAAVIGCTACGAQQPQAPVTQARTVSAALSTIASMCGEAYRATESPLTPTFAVSRPARP